MCWPAFISESISFISLSQLVKYSPVTTLPNLKGFIVNLQFYYYGKLRYERYRNIQCQAFQVIETGEKVCKPYYKAHMNIQTLALLDERYIGVNWWRFGEGGIRTLDTGLPCIAV